MIRNVFIFLREFAPLGKWALILFAWLFVIVAPDAHCQNLPKILNPGDTAIATTPLWVQSLDSEIDQRLEIKGLKEKLTAYAAKVKEIDVLQALIDSKEAEKQALLESGISKTDSIVVRLSTELKSCGNDLTQLTEQANKLQKQISRLERSKNTWRTVSLTQSAIIALGAVFLIFKL